MSRAASSIRDPLLRLVRTKLDGSDLRISSETPRVADRRPVAAAAGVVLVHLQAVSR